jgi:hypothetical protein
VGWGLSGETRRAGRAEGGAGSYSYIQDFLEGVFRNHEFTAPNHMLTFYFLHRPQMQSKKTDPVP